MRDDQPAVARAIATIAHRGQTDKAGNAYITHPARVAARVGGEREALPHLQAVAWLHDVIEDTDITAEDLLGAGVLPAVVADVQLLTRTGEIESTDYYAAIAGSPTALAVKLADIADNTDPTRLALLDAETVDRLTAKYARALQLLKSTAN